MYIIPPPLRGSGTALTLRGMPPTLISKPLGTNAERHGAALENLRRLTLGPESSATFPHQVPGNFGKLEITQILGDLAQPR